jgi:hypothetical protein
MGRSSSGGTRNKASLAAAAEAHEETKHLKWQQELISRMAGNWAACRLDNPLSAA